MPEWANNLRLRLKSLFRRRELDRDLEDEVAFHLTMRAESKRANGVEDKEARYAARRALGNVTSLKEACREM
jgi:hypothetical protein